jgi:RelE toxin of RelE / RelB toxin-antitoxin system
VPFFPFSEATPIHGFYKSNPVLYIRKDQAFSPVKETSVQIFKNKWFSKFAKEEGILDKELCEAVRDAERGLIEKQGTSGP